MGIVDDWEQRFGGRDRELISDLEKQASLAGYGGAEIHSEYPDIIVQAPSKGSSVDGKDPGGSERALSDVEKKDKKKGVVEEVPVETAPPPYYAPAPAAAAPPPPPPPSWRTRRALFIAIGILLLLIVLLATLLGVLISRNHSNSASSPSNPSPSSPLPSSLPQSGDASAPIPNTAISAVSVLDNGPTSAQGSSFVKVFFQDKNLYLCEKSSLSDATSWALNNSGSRIIPAMNGTPIVAVSDPDNVVPIRVFFINTDGFLADIVQDVYGGSWANGSLSDRRFRPGEIDLGTRTRSLGASWCSMGKPAVFAEGDDLQLYAFQLSSGRNSSTWSLLAGNHGGNPGISSSFNIASVCTFDGESTPVVFVNTYNGTESTGHLSTYFKNTNSSVTFPPATAALYRPNTQVGAVFGNFAPTDAPATQGYNYSLFLFYPLPQSLSQVTPSPSIHFMRGDPYAADTLNWTAAVDIDTGIVPFALGKSALFSPASDLGRPLSVGQGVDDAMPRAWTPLALVGRQRGRVVVVYQTEDGGGVKVADVLGGQKGGSYDAIVPVG